MRLRELNEAIANRPRTANYYIVKAKELRQLDSEFKKAGELLNIHFTLSYELSKVLDNYDLVNNILNLGHTLSSEYGPFGLVSLAETLESYIKYQSPGYDFFKYIIEALKNIKNGLSDRPDISNLLQQIPSYEKTINLIKNDKDWYLLNPEYHGEEEINEVTRFLEAIKILAPAFKKYKTIIEDLDNKINAQSAFRVAQSSSNPAQWKPQHNDIELLYHATAYINEIINNGFQNEKPEGRKGVGNIGYQNDISVTHDLKIATDIMRSLKELTMIANHELTARQIAGWVKIENIPNFPWRELTQISKGENKFGYPQYEKITFEQFNIVQTARLYEKYIWLSKIHPNPVFVHIDDLVKTLVGKSVNDIGVLACQIDLTKVDFSDTSKRTYETGESEFRVPPNSILSVRRIM
jgi:hypothetical protein